MKTVFMEENLRKLSTQLKKRKKKNKPGLEDSKAGKAVTMLSSRQKCWIGGVGVASS